MRALGVIPCRMAASRLPGKPLRILGDRPIVRWVHDATVRAGIFDVVIVATPDQEIVDAVTSFGGRAELTRLDHATGTDRVAEVADRYPSCDVVVNVQGDQPFVDGHMLSALVAPFSSRRRPVMTTVAALLDASYRDDPNTVKVVRDVRGDALYFSRSPIPHQRDGVAADTLQHIGLYGFDREFLAHYPSLPTGELEAAEGLEQLRVLEHGHRIRVEVVSVAPIEINTEDDLRRANLMVMS